VIARDRVIGQRIRDIQMGQPELETQKESEAALITRSPDHRITRFCGRLITERCLV
jgi:hypothetical protein